MDVTEVAQLVASYVTDATPLPVTIVETAVPFDIRRPVTTSNPLPVSLIGGGAGGTQVTGATAPAVTGAINGINRVYVLPSAAAAGSVKGYINGLRVPPADLGLAGDGVTVTLAVASTPQNGDIVYFDYEEA